MFKHLVIFCLLAAVQVALADEKSEIPVERYKLVLKSFNERSARVFEEHDRKIDSDIAFVRSRLSGRFLRSKRDTATEDPLQGLKEKTMELGSTLTKAFTDLQQTDAYKQAQSTIQDIGKNLNEQFQKLGTSIQGALNQQAGGAPAS